MRMLLPVLLVFFVASCRSQDNIESAHNFFPYQIQLGHSNFSALAKLYHKGELVISYSGVEGVFSLVDTANINGDGFPDFVLQLASDDYFTVHAFISINESEYAERSFKRYFFFGDIYCDTENEALRYIYLKDIDLNGLSDALINVLVDEDGEIETISCSDTLKFYRLTQ